MCYHILGDEGQALGAHLADQEGVVVEAFDKKQDSRSGELVVVPQQQ